MASELVLQKQTPPLPDLLPSTFCGTTQYLKATDFTYALCLLVPSQIQILSLKLKAKINNWNVAESEDQKVNNMPKPTPPI